MSVELMLKESYSSIQAYRRCPRLWWYGYRLRLELDDETRTVAMDLGSWWHALVATQTIRRGLALGSLLQVPESIQTTDDGPELVPYDPTFPPTAELPPTARGCPRQAGDSPDGWHSVMQVLLLARDWYESRSEEYRTAFEEQVGTSLAQRLRSMWLQRVRRWREDEAYEHPLLVEAAWQTDPSILYLPGGDSVQVVVRGRLDEVYRDTRRGLVVLRDVKSSSRLARDPEADLMDSQLHLYAAMCNRLGLLGTGDQEVEAVQYDRTMSKAPTVPRLTATGALAKNVTAFDLDTYLAWSRGEDGEGVPWGTPDTFYVTGKRQGEPKFGVYRTDPAEVERLSTPGEQDRWVRRTFQPLNVQVVEAHLASVDHTLSGMSQDAWMARGDAPECLPPRDLSPSLVQGTSCKMCDFADLCRAQMYGGDTGEYDYAEYGLRTKLPSQEGEIAEMISTGLPVEISGTTEEETDNGD